jgi:hypothetical protein
MHLIFLPKNLVKKEREMKNDYLFEGVRQLKGIIAAFQNELAGLLWVDTLEARQREKVLVNAICAHMQAVDKLEAMMAE